MGQKPSGDEPRAMSALLPKADMCGATRDVRYGPIADIHVKATSPSLWMALLPLR